MSRNFLVVSCLLALVHFINPASVPFIKKCISTDSKCIKESTQLAIGPFAAGIPEFGIETLDPIKIKKIDASSPNLKLILTDIEGTGLSKCQAKKVKFENGLSKIVVKFLCTVDFNAQYEIDGQVIILKIQGKGPAHLILNQFLIQVEAALGEVVGSDGEKHLTIKDWKHGYELKEKSVIELENLFDGNEALGRAAKDLIQGSPNEIISELGPPIIKEVAADIIENVEKLFKNVPIKDMVES